MATDPVKLLEEYLDYLEIEKNRSIKTRENYERYLKSFFAWADIKSVLDIDADMVKKFRIFLARSPKKSRNRNADETLGKKTQAYYIIALRNFLKYLLRRDIEVLSPDKIELPKISTRQIEIPREADLERLLKAPEIGTLRGLRDKAILETLFSTGLRLSELCALSRHVDLSRGEMSVRGKGGKLRVVFISDDAKTAIKNYLAKRGDAEEALFISYSGSSKTKKQVPLGRVTSRAVERLVSFYAKKAGIQDRVTPHMLRHLFATDLLSNGADLRSVQEMLGHASVMTTQVYTHLTNRGLKEVHRAFHGKRK